MRFLRRMLLLMGRWSCGQRGALSIKSTGLGDVEAVHAVLWSGSSIRSPSAE